MKTDVAIGLAKISWYSNKSAENNSGIMASTLLLQAVMTLCRARPSLRFTPESKNSAFLLGNFGVPLANTLTIPKKSGRWLVFCIPPSKSDAVHEYGRALQ